MNQVVLIGRATKEPEEIGKIIRFNIAVDRKYKVEGQPTADFPLCIAFGKIADTIKKYMQKGQKYAIIGHLQTGSYKTKDGHTVNTTNVVVDSFEFVESRGHKAEAPAAVQEEAVEEVKQEPPVHQEAPVYPQSDFVNIPDDYDLELPFN